MAGLFTLEKTTQKQIFFASLRLCVKSFLFLLTFVILFSNCRSESANPQITSPTREITDDLGHQVKLPETIERAVSLAPNLTEITFAVGAGDKLVGRTSYDNFPLEAQKIQTVGDTLNPNIENIIALKPQVVLVSTASQIETFTRQLEAQNIAVFVTNPNSLDDIYKSIYQIGEIFGKEAKAREIVIDLRKRVDDVETRTNTAEVVKVFLQISKEPLFTIGKESFLTDLINRAGGISVTANVTTAYPELSKETALALNPEAIILSDSEDNKEPNDVLKISPAMRNGKVFRINADLLSRPSPRIVDALEQIARALHPESFQ
ncbi:MAG: ABC transporter substrate-binding protein [Pyrinomonadaceae bacterium]